MIKKFIHIKNVGRYSDFDCRGDQTLKKLNLFYGENGRGKTTIASILRSLSSGDPNPIKERKTLGSTVAEDIEILLDTGTAKFNGSGWSLLHDGILIFDHRFVLENIHVGESVDINTRRNLAGVILGERGAEISKQIKDQDAIARAKLETCNGISAKIKSAIPASMMVDAYVASPPDSEIEKKIEDKTREMDAAKRASSLKVQPLLKLLPVPELADDFVSTLTETVESISSTAETKVRVHLSASHMKGAEEWLSEGVEFMNGTTCPVCGQSVDGVDILTAFKDYFSYEYNKLRDKVAGLDDSITESVGEVFEASFERTVSDNLAPFEFWKELLSISLPKVPDIETLKPLLANVAVEAQALLLKKKASILESVSVEGLTTLLATLSRTIAEITTYNEAITLANEAINTLKTKTSFTPLSILESNMAHLKAVKARHTEAGIAQIALLESAKKERDAAVAAKDNAQKDLTEYSKEIVNAYEKRINEMLKEFGAGFSISGVETGFPAGTPASSYHIEINGISVEAGKPQIASPSFQTMLSGGDKSTLALAFFFASFEQDVNKGSKVIFLDDPFSSQDENRRNKTGKLIRKALAECAQVIVSSHESSFLRSVWEQSSAADCKTLKLTRKGVDETTIVEWDIEHDTKHPFLRLHDELTKYMAGALMLQPADVQQKLRPLLEDYFRFRFPNVFRCDEWLGQMVKRISNDGATHPMHAHLTALQEVNTYTSPSHHTSGVVDETELRTYVTKTLNIVGQT